MAAEYVTKVRTSDGEKQINYYALANIPDHVSVDETAINKAALDSMLQSPPDETTSKTMKVLNAIVYAAKQIKTWTASQLGGKVDKVNGMGLSTNDYTTLEKAKLEKIAEGANNYSLPVAGTELGGVKNGGEVIINADGTMSLPKEDNVRHFNMTIPYNDGQWLGQSTPYQRTINVNGILETDTPIVDVVLSDIYNQAELELESWGYIYNIKTEANSIIVYATEIPEVQLNIHLEVHR